MPYSKALLSGFAVVFITIVHLQGRGFVNLKAISRLIVILSFFLFLCICHLIVFGYVGWFGVLGYLLKLIIAYCALHYYYVRKESFELIYINLLYRLSLISLPMYFINYFMHIGIKLERSTLKSTFIYTSYDNSEKFIRNSGMFWEPGAFSGYLIIALMFIVSINGKFKIGAFKKEFIWILVGILTTMSTSGYLILCLIVLIYISTNYRLGKFIIVPFFGMLFFYFFQNLDFMQSKILGQFEEAMEMGGFDVSNTRFGALVMDLEYVKSSPWYGNGLHNITRFRFHPWVTGDIGHGNGMSNFIVFWGVPMFLIWLLTVYSFFKHRLNNQILSFICVFILLLLLQGEQFLNYPFFLVFFFFSAFNKRLYFNEGSVDC